MPGPGRARGPDALLAPEDKAVLGGDADHIAIQILGDSLAGG